MYNNKKKLYYEADYFIHCIHIYYNDVFFCTRSPLLSIIKARDNKSTEFFKNKNFNLRSPQWSFSVRKSQGLFILEGGKEVLIGASVIEVGSTNGTITDIDGEYSIGISKADKKILKQVIWVMKQNKKELEAVGW